eukprot:gene3803-7568_t
MSEFSSVSSCNTCKSSFPSVESVRGHYKTEWHVFNSKRRSNGLAPVGEADFNVFNNKRNKGFKKPLPQSILLRGTLPSNVKEVPNVPQASKSILPTASGPTSSIEPDVVKDLDSNTQNQIQSSREELRSIAVGLGISNDRTETIVDMALKETLDDEEEGQEELSNIEAKPLPIGPTISIFDNKEFDTVEDCMKHMETNFGFFIPDKEYMVNLEGFLTYLGEKVKLGGICIYCQKQFIPGHPCQNHMINKSHCKITYEDDIDVDEYEDFYDFSSQYINSSDENDNENDENSEANEDRTLEISPIGELILLNGRTLGNRNLRIYYKQKYRPEDIRPAVLAQKREELLRLRVSFGGMVLDDHQVQLLSDAQLVDIMMRKQRELRKCQMIEQRAQQRYTFITQKRSEYKSTVDKLRSKANTTAKIRDYHGILK